MTTIKNQNNMRKLSILKALIDLSFYFSVLGIIAMVIFVPMYLMDPGSGIPIRINGQEITAIDLTAKIVIGLAAAGALLFIYSIYLLRKTITFFRKREIFNTEVIRCFSTIGKCLIGSALLTNFPLFIYNAVQRNHLGIQFIDAGFNSLLLSLSLGLFFMVLSEVFKIAKNMKEENELTV